MDVGTKEKVRSLGNVNTRQTLVFVAVRAERPRMRPQLLRAGTGISRTIGGGRVMCVCSYVLLEDEAGQQGGGLLRRQVVEEAVEHHFRQQQLIGTGRSQAVRFCCFARTSRRVSSLFLGSGALRPPLPADFTGDPPFHLDDVGRTGEAEAPQDSLPALELVHLQDGARFLQLQLGRSNLSGDLHKRTNGGGGTVRTPRCFGHEIILNTTITFTAKEGEHLSANRCSSACFPVLNNGNSQLLTFTTRD